MNPSTARPIRPVLVAVLTSLTLAACGGGGGGSDGGSGAVADTATASTGGSATSGGTGAGGTPAAAVRSAGECLSQASFQPGYVVTARMRSSNAGTDTLSRLTTVGPTTHAGVASTLVEFEDLVTPAVQPTRVYRQLTAGEVVDVGLTYFAVSGGVTYTVDRTVTPGQFEGLALKLGESRTGATMTLAQTVTAPGIATQSASQTMIIKATFVGFEKLVVPAGTFTDTCRIDLTTTTNGTTATATTWYANGYGFVVKTLDPSGVSTELVGLQIGQQLIAGTVAMPTQGTGGSSGNAGGGIPNTGLGGVKK